MKKLLLCLLCFPLSLAAETLSTPQDYLNAMHKAHHESQFELLYLFKQGNDLTSLRYRHATAKGKEFAQLLKLDDKRQEVILRDDVVSYFSHDTAPFSLKSGAILDSLPSAFYTQFNSLSPHYNFVDGGKARVADRIARQIRLIPRDEFRYKYNLWIDEETHLLLKSELCDRDDNLLEEFRVLQAHVDADLAYMIEPIQSLALPPLLPLEQQKATLQWQPSWLPAGFTLVDAEQKTLESAPPPNNVIESQLYSDGLFSFSLYLVENKAVLLNEQFWREDKLSIYSQPVGNKELVIIGEIPLSTAKNIVQQVQFSESAQ